MLALDEVPSNEVQAAKVIAVRGGEFAVALFQEAAASDDVTSAAAAIEYVDDRLKTFDAILDPETASLIRVEFVRLLESWR
jgi:hypothetical protein